MKGFRCPTLTQAFGSSFVPIRQYFAIKRHRVGAVRHRVQLAKRFALWRVFAGLA